MRSRRSSSFRTRAERKSSIAMPGLVRLGRGVGGALLLLSLLTLPGTASAQSGTECVDFTPPVAAFNASCASLACSFAVTSPTPPSGVAAHQWDYGDGAEEQRTSAPASHAYQEAGIYLVSLTVVDGNGEMGIATNLVAVGLGSNPTLAVDDAFTTDNLTPLTIGFDELLSNDAAGLVVNNIESACQIQPGGTACKYTPPAGFVGPRTFRYWVRDAAGNTDDATVTVDVTRPLYANPDELSTTIGRQVQFTVGQLLANDSPGAHFVRIENAEHGTVRFLEVTKEEEVIYEFVPAPAFAGTASFEYLISNDGEAPPFERGFVSVLVEDGPPQANFIVSCINRTCRVSTFATDDIGIVRYIWNWGDGTPDFEPQPPNHVADQFHTYATSGYYFVTHTVVDTMDKAHSLTLTATANTRPVAVADSAITERDIPVTIDILGNDSDADGDLLSFQGATFDRPGTIALLVQTPTGLALRVTPPDSFVGVLNGTYTIVDRWQGIATAPVTVTVNQWTSITDAIGEQIVCPYMGYVRIPYAQLLQNDFDSDGDPLSLVSTDMSLAAAMDCTTETTACTFRPGTAAGVSVFRYTITDPAGHRDSATVRIYTGVVRNPPTVGDDYFTTLRNQPRAFTVQEVTQNDVDPDGDVVQVQGFASGPRDYGSLACTFPMYQCTYTPNAGFVGTERMLYFATDMVNAPRSAYVNVLTLPPSTPTFDAREDVYVTGVNQPLYIMRAGLAVNDYDPEGDPITVSSVDTSGTGGVTCDATGCNVTPGPNWQGIVKFKYTATDGRGSSDTAIVRVRVGGTNNAPVAAADVRSTPKNTQLRFPVFDLLRNDYDPNNDPLTVTIHTWTAQKGTMACGNRQYWCTYTPHSNVTGADVLTYSLGDGTTAASSTLTINIVP